MIHFRKLPVRFRRQYFLSNPHLAENSDCRTRGDSWRFLHNVKLCARVGITLPAPTRKQTVLYTDIHMCKKWLATWFALFMYRDHTLSNKLVVKCSYLRMTLI